MLLLPQEVRSCRTHLVHIGTRAGQIYVGLTQLYYTLRARGLKAGIFCLWGEVASRQIFPISCASFCVRFSNVMSVLLMVLTTDV